MRKESRGAVFKSLKIKRKAGSIAQDVEASHTFNLTPVFGDKHNVVRKT